MNKEFNKNLEQGASGVYLTKDNIDTCLSALDVMWLGNIGFPPRVDDALDITTKMIYACGAAQDLLMLDQVEQTMRGLQTAIAESPDYRPENRKAALDKLGSCFGDVMMVKANIHEKALEENEYMRPSVG